MEVSVRPLRRRELRSAADLLCKALSDDPFSKWFVSDPRRRARAVRLVERATLADTFPFGETHGAFTEGRLVGVSAWLPPGAHHQDTMRRIRQLPRLVRAAVLMRGRASDAVRVAEAEQAIHPDQPHWWLVVVGVDPSSQGLGVGAAMVARLTARADADAQPAYLRTTNPENLGFYRRHGFIPRDEVRATPAAPPMWLLWREPGSE